MTVCDNLPATANPMESKTMNSRTPTVADHGHIKALLEARRNGLRTEVRAQLLGSGDERVVGLRNRLDETDDWAVADSLAELDIAGVRHALGELSDVDAALARMRAGNYGVCVDCGETIAPARLAAYPTATRCIECQQTFEARPGRTA
jgi:RNA polymerase-binding transcription factor DksA